MRKLTRPELWLEEYNMEGYDKTETTLRIFYPDGTSEFLSMNTYYNNGNVLMVSHGEWTSSHGDGWHPARLYFQGHRQEDTVVTLLERL